MPEKSYFWADYSVGDAVYAPIDSDEWSDFVYHLFGFGGNGYAISVAGVGIKLSGGVLEAPGTGVWAGGYNNLAVTVGAGTSVNVDSGAAMVDGRLYINTATINVALAAPVAGTNYYIVGVRSIEANQTARTVAFGPQTNPANLIQPFTHKSDYMLALAVVTVTSAGVVAVYDCRRFIRAGGSRIPAVIRRQGGSATDFSFPGTTTYIPGSEIEMMPSAGYYASLGLGSYPYMAAWPLAFVTPQGSTPGTISCWLYTDFYLHPVVSGRSADCSGNDIYSMALFIGYATRDNMAFDSSTWATMYDPVL